jgi:hypothetical protein
VVELDKVLLVVIKLGKQTCFLNTVWIFPKSLKKGTVDVGVGKKKFIGGTRYSCFIISERVGSSVSILLSGGCSW